MEILHAFWLAVVQGITEFLPVSSSAHLVLVPHFLGWPDQGIVFDIAVHLGTLTAVIVYFRGYVWTLLHGTGHVLRFQFKTDAARLTLAIGVATLPIVIAGVLFAGLVSDLGRALPVLATTSVVFGVLLWVADKYPLGALKQGTPTLLQALVFGVFQALAMVPGTSRSGACVTAGRFMGFDRAQASLFGSLMAIPTILMAGLYSLLKVDVAAVNWSTDATALAVGVVCSAVTAFLGIHVLMTFLTRVGYMPFVLYRLGLGLVLYSLVM